MKFRVAVFALLACVVATHSHASRFYFSSSDTDPTAPLDLTLNVGETGSYYLWVDPEGVKQFAVALDVLSSNPSVLDHTGIDTYRDTLAGDRWNNVNWASIGGEIINFNAFALTAAGMNPTFAGAIDSNVVNGQFLHAKVDFTALAAGTTTLSLQEGLAKINPQGDFEFGTGLITVMGGGTDPDPGIFESTPGSGGVLDFGFGPNTRTLQLAVRNAADPDDEDIEIAQAVISGPDMDLFSTPGFAPLTLVGGAADQNIGVQFNGIGTPGVYTATLELLDGAGGTLGTYTLTAAVPEPSTIALAGLGLVGLVGFMRRRG